MQGTMEMFMFRCVSLFRIHNGLFPEQWSGGEPQKGFFSILSSGKTPFWMK